MSPNNIQREKPIPIFCVRRTKKKNIVLISKWKTLLFGSSFDSLPSLIKPTESSLRETQFIETDDRKFPLLISYKLSVSGAAERLPKWGGGGTKKKGHLQREISKRKYANFFRRWYIPLHCDYNICFTLYTIQWYCLSIMLCSWVWWSKKLFASEQGKI